MSKKSSKTGVGYFTLTAICKEKKGRWQHTNTARLGFAGVVSDSKRLGNDLKGIFAKQLRANYPEDKFTMTVKVRFTFTECDMLLNSTTDGTADS